MANSSAQLRTKPSGKSETIALNSPSGPVSNRAIPVLEMENEELRLSLRQTETLMRETNHRVKNNLQMVSSLLRMQAELLKDQHAVAALKATQHRVLSMAMIHERLCADPTLDLIDFEEYTRTLVRELFDSYGMKGGRVASRLNCSKVFLKGEQALPCGLILNELVTNSLKYAYPHGKEGEVSVCLCEGPDGTVTLSVADDGVGLPEGIDWKNSTSMGLPIVDLLAKQIGGQLTVQTRPSTAFQIRFQR